MKKNKKSQKKKKKDTTKSNVETQAELDIKFEEEECTLNRELALQRKQTSIAEDKRDELEEEFQRTINDYQDIIDHLIFQTKEEESEIASIDEKITTMEEKIKEQSKYFEKIRFDIEQKLGGHKTNLESQKYNNEVTLHILNTFERERLQYLAKEQDFTEREIKQEKRHKLQVYQQDKSRRIDLQIVVDAGIAELKNAQKQFDEKFHPKKIAEDIEREQEALENELQKLAPKWIAKLKSHEKKEIQLQESEYLVELLRETTELAGTLMQKKMEKVVKHNLVKNGEEIVAAGNSAKTEGDKTQREESVKRQNLQQSNIKDEVLFKLEEGINLIDEENEQSEFQESSETEDLDDIDESFEKQSQIIKEILQIINSMSPVSQAKGCSSCEPPLPAVRRQAEYTSIGRKQIQRNHFWRNWKEPRFAARTKILQSARIHLPDVLKDTFTSKFINNFGN